MDALLLLGPTGAGKSPLGDLLAARGVAGRRCLHFDFGAALRRAAAVPRAASNLSRDQHAVIARVLRAGALLEDEEFPIAATLLADFLVAQDGRDADLRVLNGLPRHSGQAAAIDAQHRVRIVLQLTAPAEVLHTRITRNTGGDRAGRLDDARAQVAARIARYEARTVPLIEHYARRGARLVRVSVEADSTALDAYEAVAGELHAAG